MCREKNDTPDYMFCSMCRDKVRPELRWATQEVIPNSKVVVGPDEELPGAHQNTIIDGEIEDDYSENSFP